MNKFVLVFDWLPFSLLHLLLMHIDA
jgi:hypothetical protein